MRGRIAEAQRTARAELGEESIRWIDPQSMHLTLRFLGQTTPAQRERLLMETSKRASSWRSSEVELRGLGCFPDPGRPRVLWAGAYDRTTSLETIAAELEDLARQAGFEPERRPFSPHLTLARVKGPLTASGGRRLEDLLRRSAALEFGRLRLDQIALMKSDLRPTGAVYTEVGRFVLGLPEKG